MRKNPTYMALLRPTRLLISEKSTTYTIKWFYTIIWQVRVVDFAKGAKDQKILLWGGFCCFRLGKLTSNDLIGSNWSHDQLTID